MTDPAGDQSEDQVSVGRATYIDTQLAEERDRRLFRIITFVVIAVAITLFYGALFYIVLWRPPQATNYGAMVAMSLTTLVPTALAIMLIRALFHRKQDDTSDVDFTPPQLHALRELAIVLRE